MSTTDTTDPLVVVELHDLWWGVCIGGRHYQGSIHRYPAESVELRRKLGRKEAKQMAEEQGRLWFHLENDTAKFDTLRQLYRAADKWCAANLGTNWICLRGSSARYNPSEVVAVRGKLEPYKKLMNDLAAEWDKVPNSRRDWERPEVKALYAVWEKFFIAAGG
ncbi:MAG: hypothetical protein V4662_17740 [Verrucomicrobiota bacterium]